MEYRIATKEDINELVRLRIEFLNEITENRHVTNQDLVATQLKRYFNDHLDEDDFISWLAVDKTHIVGTGAICFYDYPAGYGDCNGKYGYILNIYIVPGYRRQGLAEKIMEMLIQAAREKGAGLVTLRTTKMAKQLYEK